MFLGKSIANVLFDRIDAAHSGTYGGQKSKWSLFDFDLIIRRYRQSASK